MKSNSAKGISYSLTKEDIEKMAYEVLFYLIDKNLYIDVDIYFNGKSLSAHKVDDVIVHAEKQNKHPNNYFKYINYRHILSMSFEGPLYAEMNSGSSKTRNALSKIFNKYKVYYELGDAWNLSVYPIREEYYNNIEYIDYPFRTEKVYKNISLRDKKDIPGELLEIMHNWYNLSLTVGDIGSCVIGAGFKFNYNDQDYFMHSCSPYQGNLSWENWIDEIQSSLKSIGASDINYEWGCMD